MANYCWNWVRVTASKQSLNRLESKFKKYDSTNWFTEFGDIVLEKKPREYTGQPFDFYYQYGTKWWDITLERVDDGELVISGDTAWSPPLELMKKVSKKYKAVVYCEFEEPGCDFAGEHKYENGNIIMQKDYSYDEYRYIEDKDSWWDCMMERIDENSEGTWDEFMENWLDPQTMKIISAKDLKKLKDEFKISKEAVAQST